MNLQSKLLAGFAAVALVTLVASGVGFWQTRKLSSALYEVGVVRLSSIQALDRIFEAKTALDASKRELMRVTNLLHFAEELSASGQPPAAPMQAADTEAGDLSDDGPLSWGEVLTEELRRQGNSWKRAEQGWREYAALPKTTAEAATWGRFTDTWTAWRSSYEKVMAELALARDTREAAHLFAASEENQQRLFTLSRESRNILHELVDLNRQIAAEVKADSIASRQDAEVMQHFMLAAAALSVAFALGGGILLSRRICNGLRPMTDAFARIVGGDLQLRVPVTSADEIGEMASAMNVMVESLRTTEAARKQATESLAETADRLELALRTSQLGVWRRNLLTGAAEWDDRMFELFGLPSSPSGPDREAVLAMITPEDREGVAAYWSRQPQPGQTYHYRFGLIRADGQRRQLEAHGRVQKMSGQTPEWAVGVVGDITEIVEATAESARLRERLVAAKGLEALGAQAARVAHDFNNLLTGISGQIDLATLQLPAQHEATDLLKEARAGARSARDLVLRLMRKARNADENKLEPVDLARVSRETLSLVSAGFPHPITINLQAASNLPLVFADINSMQRVLLNLCTNAAQAIGAKAGGQLDLIIEPQELTKEMPGVPGCPAGRYLCLTVKDNGCGMDAATQPHIFEPYFTTKAPGEGTGLGLAIVSDIMSEHKGGLTFESQVGVGTTFRLYFPLIEPAGSSR
jgi:signal transduction histidine kinase/HAMP domain-containing protein